MNIKFVQLIIDNCCDFSFKGEVFNFKEFKYVIFLDYAMNIYK